MAIIWQQKISRPVQQKITGWRKYKMNIVQLSDKNIEQYLEYLQTAMSLEPEMMTAETIDENGIRVRIKDPFYRNTTSILAIEEEKVVGRLEYHFYGCMQDGCRMAYIDWVYVLPEHRHRGIAQSLFKEMERDCAEHNINQYYLIRATNPNAESFYNSFENVELDAVPLLRKYLSGSD